MQRFALACAVRQILAAPAAAPAQQGAGGQYRVLKTLRAGGEGGFDDDGTLIVVREKRPNQFGIEQTVQTMPTAKTMALDSKTNRPISIGAQYEQERDRQRGPMVPDSFTILVVGK